MATFNRVTLVGHLTKDVQLHNAETEKAVAKTRLATNDRRRDTSGELVERTMFIDVSFFGRTAEVASKYLHKGSQVLIEGRLDMYEWEDGSTRRQKHSVAVSKLVMLGKPKDATDEVAASEQPVVAAGGARGFQDSLTACAEG